MPDGSVLRGEEAAEYVRRQPRTLIAGPPYGYPTGPMTGAPGFPVPLQLPPPPPSTEPPEWVKQLAPVIMQQIARVATAFTESRESKSVLDYQEADAAKRDSKGGALVSHSVAIANLAHALGDMKETKARVETTGSLEQAISRLANACVPVVEAEAELSDGLDDDERRFVLECLRAFAEEEPRDENDVETQQAAANANAVFLKLCASWKMRFVPRLAVEAVEEPSDG